MAVGITNAPEMPPQLASLEGRYVLVNQELGPACRMTQVCGSSCHLAWSHAKVGVALEPRRLVASALETFGTSSAGLVRHWGLAAKEPLQYGESVVAIAQAWHDASPDNRPGTLGVLTAYARGLEEQAKSWRHHPLSWVLVSADPAGTALHPELDGARTMEAAVRARDCGGVAVIGVNTIVSSAVSIDTLLKMARRAESLGFEQMTVGGLYQPHEGRLEDTLTVREIHALVAAVKSEFSTSPMQFIVSLSTELIHQWVGSEVMRAQHARWRLEHAVSRNTLLVAPNPTPGYFLRLRWDGELLDHDDLMRVGTERGAFGTYTIGSMRSTLESFPNLQRRALAIAA